MSYEIFEKMTNIEKMKLVSQLRDFTSALEGINRTLVKEIKNSKNENPKYSRNNTSTSKKGKGEKRGVGPKKNTLKRAGTEIIVEMNKMPRDLKNSEIMTLDSGDVLHKGANRCQLENRLVELNEDKWLTDCEEGLILQGIKRAKRVIGEAQEDQ